MLFPVLDHKDKSCVEHREHFPTFSERFLACGIHAACVHLHIGAPLLPLDPFEHPPDLAQQIHSHGPGVIQIRHQQYKYGHGELVVHRTGFEVGLFAVKLGITEFELLVEEG